MRLRSIVDEVVVAASSWVKKLKQRVLGRVAPGYREVYRFRIRSNASLREETLRARLDDQIPTDANVEAERVTHHHFSESRLEPRELMRYHMRPHHQAFRRKTWARVVVRVSGDWETGDEVIRNLQSGHNGIGPIELSKVDIGVGNSLSESDEWFG